jgi:hypothetical protein
MNKNNTTIILLVLGAALVIFSPMVGVFAIPIWIYLLIKGPLRNRSISGDQKEAFFSEKQLKNFKTLMTIAGICFLLAIAGILMHNMGPDLLGVEEPVSFFVGVGALYIFVFSTVGALIIFLKGRQKTPS